MLRIACLLSVSLAACAATQPQTAVVVVTFDDVGAIARVESDDLAAGDPRREACAAFVGEVRASLHGVAAGAGTVTFGCPLASFGPPAERRTR